VIIQDQKLKQDIGLAESGRYLVYHQQEVTWDMEILIESLAQYGPLGLWTASLLYANYQTRKDAKAEERLLQDKVIDKLQEQQNMLEKVIVKLDLGLDLKKQMHQEARIRELNTKT